MRDIKNSNESQAELSRQLMVAIRQHQSASDMMDEGMAVLLGINRTDGRCLDIIDLHQKMTVGQLATESGLTTGAVTAVIDRLVKAGYVERLPDPVDRRKVIVQLTPAVAQIGDLVYGEMSTLGRSLMGGLTGAQMKLITHFLQVSSDMSRQMSELLRQHLPTGNVDHAERIQRARAFNRQQKKLIEDYAANVKEVDHQN